MLNMRIFKSVSIAALLLMTLLIVEKKLNSRIHILEGNIFGTYYRIKVRAPFIDSGLAAAIGQGFEEVHASMSVFREDSEVSKINGLPENAWQDVSGDLLEVLKASEIVYEESEGWFDPTIGKLVNLWGFGIGHKQNHPKDSEIKEELRHVGLNKIELNEKSRQIRKKDAKTYLNLSAVAKGFAVDKTAEIIEKFGYNDYIIDIGGELKIKGAKTSGRRGWTVGIAMPEDESGENAMALHLTDMAVATSGDYRNFYVEGQKRYMHTISPFDGYPRQHGLASATVFHPSCMYADAYATAMLAMGEGAAFDFAQRLGLPAILIIRKENGDFDIKFSPLAEKLKGEKNGND